MFDNDNHELRGQGFRRWRRMYLCRTPESSAGAGLRNLAGSVALALARTTGAACFEPYAGETKPSVISVVQAELAIDEQRQAGALCTLVSGGAVSEDYAPFLSNFKFRSEMPEAFKKMAALAFSHIAHKPETAFHVEHRPAMQHRVGQPAVSVMAANKEIKGLAVQPSFGFYVRDRTPRERPFRNSLIEIVHSAGYCARRCRGTSRVLLRRRCSSRCRDRPESGVPQGRSEC